MSGEVRARGHHRETARKLLSGCDSSMVGSARIPAARRR